MSHDSKPPSDRPFYRKWWFIGILVVFGLTVLGTLLGDTEQIASATTTSTMFAGTRVLPSSTSAATSTTSTSEAVASSSSATSSPPPSGSTGVLVIDLLESIPIELETPDGYDRDLFEVWIDADGDGCDTRAEVLIRDAIEPPTTSPGCEVGAGLWYSVYDGVWLDEARQIQIDHVVALKEAWDSGARDWDDFRRIGFGNDLTSPLTLIAVSSSSNSAKGDADPSNWLPENEDDVCRYLAAWVVIKTTWELSMDESEYGRIRNLLLVECWGTTVEDSVVAYPPAPVTTTTKPSTPTTVTGSIDVNISSIRFDGPGNDVEFGDSEYVALRNDGTGTANVGNWTVEDEANHVITIPSWYLIQPGAELRIYSGPGIDTAVAYFEGLGQAIWNNSGGDTATLRDSNGATVDTYSYSS